MDVVDLRTPAFSGARDDVPVCRRYPCDAGDGDCEAEGDVIPTRPPRPIVQKALVVGGGIAGMTAALAIADHGYEVDLVEQSGGARRQPAGNYTALSKGIPLRTSGKNVVQGREASLDPYLQGRPGFSIPKGRVGRFLTTIEKGDGSGRDP